MELTNNKPSVQGILLEDLAKEFGTPLFVYDGGKIASQYHRLKNAFDGIDLKIKYAAKALTNQAILKLLKREGAGLDVVSIQEVKLGIKAGFDPSDIMFTPNCVEFEEIVEAKNLGVTINIDNLPFLERFGSEFGNTYPVCIRINPHIEAGGNSKIMTGHIASKFGISIDQLEDILAIVSKYNMDINGVHVHSGSDFKNPEAFIKAAEKIFQVAINFDNLKFLDFGSGFKVAYKENDHVTNIEELGLKLSKVFRDFVDNTYKKPLQLWFEPGKFLVSESGMLLIKANLIKKTPACTFIGVNSGLNHLIRPMMYDAYHHIINISNYHGSKETYNVVGYICETDTFATSIEISSTKVDDILAIKNAGAYCFSMSSNYNSRLRPAEILIDHGKYFLIRKRETFEDLLRNQIEIQI